ncbi:MAG: hypothetical protein EOS85_26925 [Mesorhizobium sp.]|nr:MAG: hypothetical protein EOS85_26925 [Mesorhizobium sp.]
MPSSEFEALCANINDLKSNFLDFGKRDDGEYTLPERMKCRAFIAFSHAEVEHYLETLSLRILDDAVAKWRTSGELGFVAGAVLAFRRREKTSIPDDPMQPGTQNTLATILMEAFNSHRAVIKRNHGIKPKDFAEIYTPLGITAGDLEESLLIQLGNSGSHRGEMVHKSSSVSLPMIRDPFADEEKDMDFLIAELAKFDAKLEELKLYAPTVPAPTELPPAPAAPTAPFETPVDVLQAPHDP